MVVPIEREEEKEKGREQTCLGGGPSCSSTLQSHCTCVPMLTLPFSHRQRTHWTAPPSPPSSSQLPAKTRDGTPPSPRWRRSPSCEKLQEMVFSSSPTSSLSRPNPRRSHTLSLSGSDVFREDSKYGELLGEAVVVRSLVEYCRRGEGGRRRRREEKKEGGGEKREEGKKGGG